MGEAAQARSLRPGLTRPIAAFLVDATCAARHPWSVRSKAWGIVLAIGVTTTALGASLRVASAASEGDSAEALLRTLDQAPEAAATRETRARARAAIERAKRFRESGDETRALLAEGLALRTAELARDQARAIRAEHSAGVALRDAEDAGATAFRERALAEEAIAQSGRLRAQLEALSPDKKREPERTAAGALESGDAGAPAKAPAKAPTKAPIARDGGAK